MSEISEIMTDKDVILDLEEQNQALANEVLELKVLAEERRQFIVNGVEFGRVLLPDQKEDSARRIFERCGFETYKAGEQSLADHDADVIEKCVGDLEFYKFSPEGEHFIPVNSLLAYTQQLRESKD